VDEADDIATAGSLAVLRAGLKNTPPLMRGFTFTVLMALGAAGGRLVVPVLIEQVLDRGISGPQGYRPRFVLIACLLALGLILAIILLSRAAYIRLLTSAQIGLRELRVQTFEHIHRLSIADHTDAKRGQLTARVTSDVEQLAMFVQWGAIRWITSTTMIIGTTAIMFFWSWQLTLLVLVVYSPVIPYAKWVQARQFHAYDHLRNTVSDTLTEVSEIVMGADVIRAYNYEEHSRQRTHGVVEALYTAQMKAQRYFALYLPATDIIGALSLGVSLAVGVWWGPGWGMTSGELVGFIFLVSLLLNPITSITEVLDMTQTTMASWRKVLTVLAQPIELVEPCPGLGLATGPLAIEAEDVVFRYREGGDVLKGVSIDIPAGTRVAIVGETGSGKTTFARLLARLADPTSGTVRVGGVALPEVAGEHRRRAIRMVPQDGFLFDTTIAQNVLFGRHNEDTGVGSADADAAVARKAFDDLDLGWWIDQMANGMETEVGERGEQLSVGERQLVALARAQLADPGLLILDEATSAVDPETEQALSRALERVSAGRTTVSIAHRLSTAEVADLVLVFDAGRVVESGHHDELVALGGVYGGLYDSWLGNTRAGQPEKSG